VWRRVPLSGVRCARCRGAVCQVCLVRRPRWGEVPPVRLCEVPRAEIAACTVLPCSRGCRVPWCRVPFSRVVMRPFLRLVNRRFNSSAGVVAQLCLTPPPGVRRGASTQSPSRWVHRGLFAVANRPDLRRSGAQKDSAKTESLWSFAAPK